MDFHQQIGKEGLRFEMNEGNQGTRGVAGLLDFKIVAFKIGPLDFGNNPVQNEFVGRLGVFLV
jgi:hypothetical protein